jgi:hypothetical protein
VEYLRNLDEKRPAPGSKKQRQSRDAAGFSLLSGAISL